MEAVLTIAIPTYNRGNEVVGLLEQLDNFGVLQERLVRVVVIDNASTYPIRSRIEQIGWLEVIQLIENPYNIGLGANLLECFRWCATRWLWIVGDDDRLLPGSLQFVLAAINSADADTICINFSTDHGVNKDARSVISLSDLVANVKFSNLLFISANIYDAQRLLRKAESGYRSCFFQMPHTSMLLNVFLDEVDSKVMVRSDRVISANLDYSALSWSRSEMMQIRKHYPIVFSHHTEESVSLLKAYTTRGYGRIDELRLVVKKFLSVFK